MALTNLNSVFALKSGLAKNYVTFGDLEAGSSEVANFSFLNTTLSSTGIPNSSTVPGPFSGTNGGTAASGNLSTSLIGSGSQLSQASGNYSLGVTSTSAGVQGDMLITTPVSIDIEDQTHLLAWRAAYKVVSGSSNMTFSASNTQTWAVFFFDVANGAWIQPSGTFSLVQSSGVGYIYGTFQAAYNATSYQMAIVQINAASGAFQIYFDDFFLGPQGNIVGPAISDLVNYGATTIGITSGTAPTKPIAANVITDKLEGKRLGDIGYVAVTYEQNAAGTAGTASQDYLYSLPGGWSFNLNVYPAYQGAVANSSSLPETSAATKSCIPAQGNIFYNATDYAFTTCVIPWNATQFRVFLYYQAGADLFCQGSGLMPLSAAGLGVSFSFHAPMQGWSSNSALSSDVNNRIVAAYALSSTPNSSITSSYTKITWASSPVVSSNDSVNGWSATNNNYVVQQTGWYWFSVTAENSSTTGTVGNELLVRVNNTTQSKTIANVGGDFVTSGSTMTATASGLLYCNANDVIEFDVKNNAAGSLSWTTADSGTYFSIFMLQGPVTVNAADSVVLSANTSSSAITGSLGTVTYSNKIQDTHNQYTGGVYTIADPGAYMIVANLAVAATFALNNTVDLQIQQGGSASQIAEGKQYAPGAVTAIPVSASDVFHCLANDTITVKASSSGTSPSIVSSASQNNFSIVRVGNY